MKKLILTLTIAFTSAHSLLAQSTTVANADSAVYFKNYIFGEVAGSGFGLSLNYERFLSKKPGGLSIRIGAGFGVIPGIFGELDEFYATVPIGVSYNVPISANNRNFFEVGTSYTYISAEDLYGKAQVVSAVVGFRHTSKSGKTQIRLTVLPLIYNLGNGLTHATLPGFSIGTRF